MPSNLLYPRILDLSVRFTPCYTHVEQGSSEWSWLVIMNDMTKSILIWIPVNSILILGYQNTSLLTTNSLTSDKFDPKPPREGHYTMVKHV